MVSSHGKEIEPGVQEGWDWIDDQSQVLANVGFDSPNYQGVHPVWTLRHRSCIVNGAIRGDVGVGLGGRHVIAGSDIGHRGGYFCSNSIEQHPQGSQDRYRWAKASRLFRKEYRLWEDVRGGQSQKVVEDFTCFNRS